MSEVKDRWDAAVTSHGKTARELENAAYPYVGELVRKHFPKAVLLGLFGQMNEDYVNVLRADRLVLADGSVVGDIVDGVVNEDFEAMAEEVEEVLSWLIDLSPDSWFGEHEIEVAAES